MTRHQDSSTAPRIGDDEGADRTSQQHRSSRRGISATTMSLLLVSTLAYVVISAGTTVTAFVTQQQQRPAVRRQQRYESPTLANLNNNNNNVNHADVPLLRLIRQQYQHQQHGVWGLSQRLLAPPTHLHSETSSSSSSSSSSTETSDAPPERRRYGSPGGGGGGGPGGGPGGQQPRRRYNSNNASFGSRGGRIGGGGGGRGGGGGGNNGQRPLSNNQQRTQQYAPGAKLMNPMKVQQIIPEGPPPREQRRDNDRGDSRGGGGGGGGGGGRSRGPVGSISDRGSGGGGGRPQQGNYNDKDDRRETAASGKKQWGRARGDGSGDGPSGGGGGGAATADFGGGGRGNKQRRNFSPAAGRKQGGGGGRNNNDDGGRNNRRTSLRVGSGSSRKGRAAQLTRRRGSLKRRDRTAEKEARAEAAIERRTVDLPDGPITVSDLAEIIDEKPVSVIKFLMTDLGVMASMTQSLDPPTCAAVTEGFGKIVKGSAADTGDDEDEDDDEEDDELDDEEDDEYALMMEESALSTGAVFEEDDDEDLQHRAPVVTIMGHVDHGKTSLLDAIRDTTVTDGEAGGITQHIAAYQVPHKDKGEITFIDTPGHAAFTDMRERGANITDIVVLVVAADDGVKQQTADSIVCARQAGVPVVVAINKCDKETADPMKVMTELTGYDVLTEELGGDILSSQISAKEGTNIDELLDKVMLQAELQDLKANPDRDAECIVIEAQVEKGLGTVATTLVKKGTLRVGDIFVAGESYGRVRALISTSDEKTRLTEAGPSVPVRVVGFEGVPAAGDLLLVAKDEQTARELAESRQRIARERQSSSYQSALMGSVAMAFGAQKARREMCVLVKADVQGSAEALARSLSELKLENDEAVVTVKVLVSEAGEVSKSDVAIASVTPDTTVIAFNVAASFAAMEDARAAGVPIEYYNIVYDAIESVESRMQEVLSPTPEGEYAGSAEVQEVFSIGGTGSIAGSRCTDGYLRKGANVRVMRGDKILIESQIKSLRNFKAEADQIDEGNECGIGLLEFEAFEPGDVIECYID